MEGGGLKSGVWVGREAGENKYNKGKSPGTSCGRKENSRGKVDTIWRQETKTHRDCPQAAVHYNSYFLVCLMLPCLKCLTLNFFFWHKIASLTRLDHIVQSYCIITELFGFNLLCDDGDRRQNKTYWSKEATANLCPWSPWWINFVLWKRNSKQAAHGYMEAGCHSGCPHTGEMKVTTLQGTCLGVLRKLEVGIWSSKSPLTHNTKICTPQEKKKKTMGRTRMMQFLLSSQQEAERGKNRDAWQDMMFLR